MLDTDACSFRDVEEGSPDEEACANEILDAAR